MQQIMGDLVKHYEDLFPFRQTAVNCDEMPAEDAIIKTFNAERKLFDGDLEPAAEPVKIRLIQRSFVPADIQTCKFCEGEKHGILCTQHHIMHLTRLSNCFESAGKPTSFLTVIC